MQRESSNKELLLNDLPKKRGIHFLVILTLFRVRISRFEIIFTCFENNFHSVRVVLRFSLL